MRHCVAQGHKQKRLSHGEPEGCLSDVKIVCLEIHVAVHPQDKHGTTPYANIALYCLADCHA